MDLNEYCPEKVMTPEQVVVENRPGKPGFLWVRDAANPRR